MIKGRKKSASVAQKIRRTKRKISSQTSNILPKSPQPISSPPLNGIRNKTIFKFEGDALHPPEWWDQTLSTQVMTIPLSDQSSYFKFCYEKFFGEIYQTELDTYRILNIEGLQADSRNKIGEKFSHGSQETWKFWFFKQEKGKGN